MKKIPLLMLHIFLLPGVASASVSIPTSITIDMGTVGQLIVCILTALALMWGLRKIIKTINRS